MDKTNHIDTLLKDTDAILFDVDGTLIDSMWVWPEVDRIYLNERGKEVPDGLVRMLSGLSIHQAADYFRDVIGINETNEEMLFAWNELARQQYEEHVPLKPGALKWLQTLRDRGIKMAVGTSNTRFLAMTVLEKHDLLQFFPVILTGEDVIKGKPDPYIYLTAANRLGVDPSRCIVFEDIREGIMAGKAAGMRTVAVWDDSAAQQWEEKKELADYYIHDFEDLFNNRLMTD